MKSTGRMIVTVMFGWLVLQPVSATEWQVPSWRKWLIEQEVKTDTVVKPSVMFPASEKPKRVDTHPFACGPYWVDDPPPLFPEPVGGYDFNETFGQALIEGITDILIRSLF